MGSRLKNRLDALSRKSQAAQTGPQMSKSDLLHFLAEAVAVSDETLGNIRRAFEQPSGENIISTAIHYLTDDELNKLEAVISELQEESRS